jgi:hypothetical protein
MRLFLGFYLFYMVFSCLATAITPVLKWRDDYKLQSHPLALPTKAELQWIREGVHPGGYTSSSERYLDSFGSLATFFIPGTDPMLAESLQSDADYFRVPLLWMETRLLFIGEIIGIGQRWQMFSPDVATQYTFPRFRLVFEDGTSTILRSDCEPPEDLLQPVYPFWFNEKTLRPCYLVFSMPEARKGMMNHLHIKYRENEEESRLAFIEILAVTHYYLPIGKDSRNWYRAQSGPPEDQVKGPLWIYDARKGTIDKQ